MKKLLSLLFVILILFPYPVKSEEYRNKDNYFFVELTDTEGKLHYKDPTTEKTFDNNFYFESTWYKIKIESFKYSTLHSAEYIMCICYPEKGYMVFIAQAKPGQHTEPWEITLTNGDDVSFKTLKDGYLYLKIPIHFGENKINAEALYGHFRFWVKPIIILHLERK